MILNPHDVLSKSGFALDFVPRLYSFLSALRQQAFPNRIDLLTSAQACLLAQNDLSTSHRKFGMSTYVRMKAPREPRCPHSYV
jgi:hypothetical protein